MSTRTLLVFGVIVALGHGTGAMADDGWALKRDGKLCYLAHDESGQSMLVWHMRFAGRPDSGIVELSFRSAALEPALAQKDDFVWVWFEPEGTISGKQTPVDSGFVSTVVMSDRLQGQFDMIGKASKAMVKTKNAKDTFDLTGLSAALPSLIDCGITAAQP
jgi:hypothetical protein